MGADLICFIVKGPKTLPEDRNPIIAAVATTMRLFNGMADGEGRDPTPEEVAYLLGHPDFDVEYDLIEYSEDSIQDSAEKVVKRLYHWWDHGARDTVVRADPDDDQSVLLVAGDSTWGDSPGGTGYELLDELRKLGLWGLLGFR